MSAAPVWLQYTTTGIALPAFVLSAVSLYLQRRDKRPRLRVTWEASYPKQIPDSPGSVVLVESMRIANPGGVPVRLVDLRLVHDWSYQIRKLVIVRMLLLPLRPHFPKPLRETSLPLIDEEEWPRLREGQVKLPYTLEPGDRVRLSVDASAMRDILAAARFSSYTRAVVVMLDALGNRYTAHKKFHLVDLEAPPVEP